MQNRNKRVCPLYIPDETEARRNDMALPSPFCFLNPVGPWRHLVPSFAPVTLVVMAEDI